MCGISGLLGNGDSSIANSMAARLAHRGPDGSGKFDADVGAGAVALAQARLSIVDLNGSWQPIQSEHNCVLIQNGEIYNHKIIRKNNSNYPWNTSGDAETILALHKRGGWDSNIASTIPESIQIGGLRCTQGVTLPGNPAEKHIGWVSQLDGVWGFAIWDDSARQLILCRDGMGVNPLVRTILADGTLLFGSEVKCFWGHPEFRAVPDVTALHVRLAYEYPLDRTTLFANVSSVGPGTIETWSLDKDGKAVLTGVAQYSQDIVSPSNSWDPATGAQPLLDSLCNSLEDRLMADVPVGIVLSGGLDSSLVAALADKAADSTGNPVPECWTVAGSEDNPDLLASREVTANHELVHHTKILEEDDFWRRLPSFVWSGEDLDITVLFWQPLFEEMSKKVRVGLCGQGADELHAGYPRFRDISSHADLIQNRMDLGGQVSIDANSVGLAQPWVDGIVDPKKHMTDLTSTLQFEMDRGQLANFQLRLGDRHSMAYGLELRVPFLGAAHRKASHHLPLNWRLSENNEKMALREAAKLTNLPNNIIHRPKIPAGTATAPSQISNLINELKPRALEWASEYGNLAPMLRDQPDMAIGLRIFHAMHFTDSKNGMRSGSLLDVLDDVSNWGDLIV